MTDELVHVPSLRDRMDYSRALAQSDLLPVAYRGKPANVLLAVEHGQALGIPAMTAIQGIHVIQGKPTLSSDLMAALVRRAGHKLRVRVDGGRSATAELIRHDDPEYTFSATWDLDRARAAQLLNKDTWKQHPAAMLKARAISEVIREGASEVLHGLIYTPEELGGEPPGELGPQTGADPDTGEILDGELVDDPAPTDGSEPEPTSADATGEESLILGGQVVEPGRPIRRSTARGSITEKQKGMIHGLMKRIGLEERPAAMAYVERVVGRPVAGRDDLSKTEASQLLDTLTQDEKNLTADTEDDTPPAA